MSQPQIHALIPAAGSSRRFGGTTLKQYMHLCGKPLINYSIEAVRRHPAILGVTVALAENDGIYDQHIRPRFPDVGTTLGGPSRAQTVMNGLEYILAKDPSAEWVLVHDAARPCLPPRCLDELIAFGLASRDGALLAIPVSDTIKRSAADGRIENTVSREGLWQAQTPQLFPARRLAEALAEALPEKESPTDEAEAMERAGARPLLVMGAQANIKITRPEDLHMAEALLKAAGLDTMHKREEHAQANRAGH